MSATTQEQFAGRVLAPEIGDMLTRGELRDARAALEGLFDPEIADVLMELDPRHLALAYRLLPRDRSAEIFALLPLEKQEELLSSLTSQQMAQLFNSMTPDDVAELFDELPGRLAAELLNLLGPEERREAQIILGYPAESIGRIMTPNYLRVRPDWTVAEVLEHIRQRGEEAETLDTLYVVDRDGKLVADVRLRDLLLAPPDTYVAELMSTRVPFLNARDDQEVAVSAFERHDRPVLPVVDSDGVLVGVVTFDDVADVAEEEVTEDIHKMAGVEALEEPYLHVSVPELLRKRAPWLAVLFVGEMATASAMEHFEGALRQAIVLTVFIPLIISSGGNSGSQGTSLIIRAMAVGEIALKDWARVLQRELLCGLLLGLFLGVIGMARVVVWHESGMADYTEHFLLVAVTVGTAVVGVVLWANLVGSMLPFLLRRFGLDPATSSAPFVATLVDVTGLIIYFTTAILILRGTLL